MSEHGDLVAQSTRLADLLGDARGSEILVELQKAAHGAPGPDRGPAPSRRVGIWSVTDTPDGPGLRRGKVPVPVRRLWADVATVPGKGTRSRVAVVGESSARGYLLDPVITPSAVLQRELDHRAADRFQCVDLARTGAEIRELGAVVAALPLIDADVLVLIAGNNWSMHSLTVPELDELADAVATGGAPALRAAFARCVVQPRMDSLLAAVQRGAEEGGVRVVVVVPEFNLSEWDSDLDSRVPLRSAGELRCWHELARQLRAAVSRARWEDVLSLADRMTDLDGGTTPLPDRARGEALLHTDDPAGARQAWERSRDAVSGLLAQHTPRVTRQIQDTLRSFAAEHDHPMVDLTVEFADPTCGLPDPGYFLDYCHLSAAGMAVLARAIAGHLAGAPATELPLPGEPRDRAIGHLLAASHNAWLRQPAATLRRHLTTALREDPAVREEITACHDMVGRSCPAWMSEAFDVLCTRPHAARYLAEAALTSFSAMQNTALPGVLSDVLGDTSASSPGRGSVDLLAGRKDNVSDLVFGLTIGYYRSVHPVFRADLWITGKQDHALRLVYRTPHGGGTGQVIVDGQPVCPLPSSREWRELTCSVPSQANQLAIEWPECLVDVDEQLADAVRVMRRGAHPNLYAAFGDLFEAELVITE